MSELLQLIQESPHDKVRVAVVDMDGVLRGKIMHKDKFLSVIEGGFGFCDVVFGWDSGDVAYNNSKFTGWHTGYPDAEATPDLNTIRLLPWNDDLPFCLADFSKNKKAAGICPRSLLKRVINQCASMGYEAYFSQEFEWFNFAETPQSAHEKGFQNLDPLTPGMFGYSILRSSQEYPFVSDLFESMSECNIPIEGIHTETGPGVYEAAIQYSDILEAADRAAIFKTATKEIASQHGIMATFMAKWNKDLPGCSGHVHQSLKERSLKENQFYDGKADDHMSLLLKQYMAGQLQLMPELLVMFAPTVNSYKRLVEGAWAPTTVTWGVDNRTTALRPILSSEKSARLETRVVGSDTNPYLAMAACLASGLYGIEQKLDLNIPPTQGSGYQDVKAKKLPSNLYEATQLFAQSEFANIWFGEAFVEHFAATRMWEWQQFQSQVTDWELKRYMEII